MTFTCPASIDSSEGPIGCCLPRGHAGAHYGYGAESGQVRVWPPAPEPATTPAPATLDELLEHLADLARLADVEGFPLFAALLLRHAERVREFRRWFDRDAGRPSAPLPRFLN